MFHFIKLGKKLEFENKRNFFEFLMFHFIKLGKKLEFENKRKFFEFLMFHFFLNLKISDFFFVVFTL